MKHKKGAMRAAACLMAGCMLLMAGCAKRDSIQEQTEADERSEVIETSDRTVRGEEAESDEQRGASEGGTEPSGDASQETAAQAETGTAQGAVSLHIPLDEYPKVDGSTACLPLMAEALSRLTGTDRERAETLVSCSTTPYAYQSLADGYADLLLAYEPAEETKEQLKESGTELEYIPIGRDALVFIANEDNPVCGLSRKQLKDIYTGKITDWKDLGGSDQEIVPFQRPSSSGSQALFAKLLMQDEAPMEAPTGLYPSEMGELIERLAEYNNEGNAIGYSVYYYASAMYAKPGLKFLAVDGVAPSNGTIADGSYPLTNDFYVVIRKGEPEGSPARKIAEWLASDEGKECIEEAGYVPAP